MARNAGGIDLGTSNSSVGFMRDNVPTLISFGEEGTSVPSAIKVQRLIDLIEGRYGHAVARLVEQSKIELSSQTSSAFELPMLDSSASVRIYRSEFGASIDAAAVQLSTWIADGLSTAQIQSNKITSVFYTGGSSSVPCLQIRIRELFPQAAQVQGDVFGSVGLGLTLDAARKFA